MSKFTLWKGLGKKSKDYKFVDRIVSEQYRRGGVEFWIHKYLGPETQTANGDATLTNTATSQSIIPELDIQDVLNMEIRDRTYDPDIYSLMGHYQITDNDFGLTLAGMTITNDTLSITFHLNDMVNQIGRKLMMGDVIEVIHLRDDLVLGSDIAVSKFYVVDEGTRPAEGWDPNWLSHIWRVRCQPISDTQEYRNILNLPPTDTNGDPIKTGNGPSTLADILSTYNKELAISDAIVAEAENQVQFRTFQPAHLYVLPADLDKPESIWAGDGIPPNGSKPVDSGESFPDAAIGSYFLRTDYQPPILYKKTDKRWKRIKIDYRQPWVPTNETLITFINNDSITTYTDDTTHPEKQNIRTAVKPKLDPDII